MKKSMISKEEEQLGHKRKEAFELCELAARDWSRLKAEQRKEILNMVEFDIRYLRDHELKLVKEMFAEKGILTEDEFDELVKRGYQVDGIPQAEKLQEVISQSRLDDLLAKAIPKKGFLRDYIDIFSEVTDAPEAFLFWGAMVTLSTILGKKVWIPWAEKKLYPNIWCVFLAPSGFRKGTGIGIPVLLLRRVDESLLLPQVGSEEGLTKALAVEEPDSKDEGLVRWMEFSKTLKGWTSKGTWQACQEFWINLWDNEPWKKKLSSGKFTVPTTSISFLSASTPRIFSTFFTSEDLEGGFFGRVYLISCLKKKKYFPIPPSIDQKGGLNDLVKQLHDIRENFIGQLSYLKFEDGFNHWAKEIQQKHEKGFMDSFYSRIETHCMKLAMIYEAALTGKAAIGEEAFRYAINALEFLVASAQPLISEEIGITEEEKRISRIARYIQGKVEVRRSTIMKNFHLTAFEAQNIEATLVQRELIEIDEKKAGRGPKRKVYLWSLDEFHD